MTKRQRGKREEILSSKAESTNTGIITFTCTTTRKSSKMVGLENKLLTLEMGFRPLRRKWNKKHRPNL